jgi:glutaredoxin-like protein NrdH
MNITLYTQPNCMPCRATKRKLNSLHIPHQTVDLTKDPASADFVRELGAVESPVIVVLDGPLGEQWWSGYRPDRLAALADALADACGEC